MSRKRAAMVAVALVGVVVLTGCGGASGGGDAQGAGDTIRLGFMGDLTGESSGIVIPPRNGAKLAVQEYNATNPPKKVELIEYDSQGTADQAVPLIQKAIQQDRIIGLVGPAFSGESKAVGPILEQAKLPSISPSATNPGLAQNGWRYWHRIVANDNDQGPAIADFLIRTQRSTRAYVISDDQEYSVGLADAALRTFQTKGVTVERDQFAQTASDYSSTVAKVTAFRPDVVVYGGYYAQAGRLLKQLRDGGVTAAFAAGDGSRDPGLVSGAGAAAAEGAFLACPCNVPVSATGPLASFQQRYKAAFGIDASIYAAEGYDAATLFLNALKAGSTTSDAINTWLAGATLDGMSKKIAFRQNGEPDTSTVFISQVKNGTISQLGVSTEASTG